MSEHNEDQKMQKCKGCNSMRPIDHYIGKKGQPTKTCMRCRTKYHRRVKQSYKKLKIPEDLYELLIPDELKEKLAKYIM